MSHSPMNVAPQLKSLISPSLDIFFETFAEFIENGQGFLDKAEINKAATLIIENFQKISHIPGLKTDLYEHQKRVVMAMVVTELTRVIKNGNKSMYYSAGFLSEPVGSGKTIDILSLILLLKTPKVLPTINPVVGHCSVVGVARIKNKRILPVTLVFVNPSVVVQWELQVKKYTNLNVFMAANFYGVEKLVNKIYDGSIENYDLVIVKNDKMVNKCVVNPSLIGNNDYFSKLINSSVQQIDIYRFISMLEVTWARVVIDDFDNSHDTQTGVRQIPALFTWFVSSTLRGKDGKTVLAETTINKFAEKNPYFESKCNYVLYPPSFVTRSTRLYNTINVKCDSALHKVSMEIPHVKYGYVLLRQPDEAIVKRLGYLSGRQIDEIREAINSDAIGQAASLAGTLVVSVYEIYKKILSDNFDKYMKATQNLMFIEHNIKIALARKPLKDVPQGHRTIYDESDFNRYKMIEYHYENVDALLEKLRVHNLKIKDSHGKQLARVKSSYSDGECQICNEPFDEKSFIGIEKQCFQVFCGKCALKITNFIKGNNQTGHCPCCRAEITIADIMIIQSAGQNMLNEENVEDKEEAAEKKRAYEREKLGVQNIESDQDKLSKYEMLIKIINGTADKYRKRVDLAIANTMKGVAYLSETKTRKVLVFSNFDETLQKIESKLKEENITYWNLRGTPKELATTVENFAECKTRCALIINSVTYCSGLNLQMATDLVYFHIINSKSHESQVMGRGQRIGRRSPLNVWYLVYKNELAALSDGYYCMRTLSDSELKYESVCEKKYADGQSIGFGEFNESTDVKQETKITSKKSKSYDSDDEYDDDGYEKKNSTKKEPVKVDSDESDNNEEQSQDESDEHTSDDPDADLIKAIIDD